MTTPVLQRPDTHTFGAARPIEDLLQLAFVGGLTDEYVNFSEAHSLESVGEAQMAHAGIRANFDRVISADRVRRLKPAPEPYQAVADAYGVDISDVRLVAAHAWDVSGALAAGAHAAFVARPGMVLSPLGHQPDGVGPDIADVVEKIIATDAAQGRP